jgi:glycosyltransferase involved in cell wall biosynthesis
LKPVISIIMPVYNAEAYVAGAITSVLSQSFEAFELILVNDGSTDRSEEIISSFKDSRIVRVHQQNQGQVAASNKGIKLAQGDYIKFLDADDLLNVTHLESQLKVLNGGYNKLASCQWAYFYENVEKAVFKKEQTHRDYANPMDWFYDSHHFDSGMLGAWLWLIPRSILEKAGYWNEKLSLNNDFDFSARLLEASEGVKFAESAKLYYRKGNLNALTHSKSRKAYESALLTTELAMQTILGCENSRRMQKLFADRFQSWIFEIYPKYQDIVTQMEKHVQSLGGSKKKPDGGKMFQLLNLIFPWKWVKWIQYFLHSTIWKPVLKWKYKQKLQKQFSE